MTPLDPMDEARLQAWHDGSLDSEDRAAFARRLETEPELRAACELDAAVTDALLRTFSAPDLSGTVAEVRRAAGGGPASPVGFSPGWRIAAAAAVIAFVIGLAVFWGPRTAGDPSEDDAPMADAVEVVAPSPAGNDQGCRIVQGWTNPPWVSDITSCSGDTFARLCEDEVGCSLKIESCEGVEPLRPRKDLRLGGALVFSSKVGGIPVLLLVNPAHDDPRPQLPEGAGFRCYRRALGDVVCYEISSLGEAKILPSLVAP